MNINNFTIKSQEAIQQAISIAQGAQQQAVEPAHLLKGLFSNADNVMNYLLQKLGINSHNVESAVDKVIESYPKVSGGEPYLSNKSSNALQKATNHSKDYGDQYVSAEHIFMGILSAGDKASQILKDAGVTEKELKKAIDELRKGDKVSSPTAENSFNSLERFAINLNQQARSGKLDPVIGRDEEIRRVLQILSRRTKNNPILIGEPGNRKNSDC